MNMDPLNYRSFYAACTDIVLRSISMYWMIGPFQLSRAGYAPDHQNIYTWLTVVKNIV